MIESISKTGKKWHDCRDVRERHDFYELNDIGTALCKNCDMVLFEQIKWIYSDDGLEYNGLVQ